MVQSLWSRSTKSVVADGALLRKNKDKCISYASEFLLNMEQNKGTLWWSGGRNQRPSA
jgi:hypothetical protein